MSSAAWPDGFLTDEVRLCVVVCAERVLKRVFPLRLLHLERMFSACVCLFPTFVGWYCLSHAGFLFHRDIADIFQSNRTWEGTVFMHKFVIKNVSCRKTSKRTDSVENAELTNIASNRTLSHSLFAKDVVPILDASFRLDASFPPTCACVLLLLVVFTYRSLVSFFTMTPQTCINATGMPRHSARPMRRPVNTKVPWNKVSKRTVKETAPQGHCGKEIEMLGPTLPVPTTRHRQTVSRQSSSPKWMETWRTNAVQTTDLSKKGFSCTSSSSPIASFFQVLQFQEQGGWVCIEEGCGLRMCQSAHHGNCSLLINESGCDHPLRAGRCDCVRGGSTHCRHQFFSS